MNCLSMKNVWAWCGVWFEWSLMVIMMSNEWTICPDLGLLHLQEEEGKTAKTQSTSFWIKWRDLRIQKIKKKQIFRLETIAPCHEWLKVLEDESARFGPPASHTGGFAAAYEWRARVHLSLLPNASHCIICCAAEEKVGRRRLRCRHRLCGDHTDCIYFSRPAETLAALFVARRRHQSVGLQFPRRGCRRHSQQTRRWKKNLCLFIQLPRVVRQRGTCGRWILLMWRLELQHWLFFWKIGLNYVFLFFFDLHRLHRSQDTQQYS